MKGLFVATYQTFIKPITEQLGSVCESIRLVETFDPKREMPVDFIWVDFCTDEALAVQEFVTKAKKILRIHSYEFYTGILDHIKVNEWDAIIFVSQRYRNLFVEMYGESNNLHVIYNYLVNPKIEIPVSLNADHNKKNIAYAGYLTRRKGIAEFYELARMMPEHDFHLAGVAQEADFHEYLMATKPDNVRFHGWQEDLYWWYTNNNISHFFLASHREGFCCSMFEAMLCGVIPVTRNWIGVEEFYPKECVWESLSEARDIILNGEITPEEIMAHAKSFDTEHGVIARIISLLCEDKKPMVLPSLSVGIVKTRNQYLPQLMNSIAMQDYPCNVIILDNTDKTKSIGKCFNELAEKCKTDFILYVGDDDVLAEDYISSAMYAYARRQNLYQNVSAILTGATIFDDNGRREYSGSYPTGFWNPEFVTKHRFDETLIRQVDTEFISRANKVGEGVMMRLPWIVGYYYRQHDKNISGNKFVKANHSQEKDE